MVVNDEVVDQYDLCEPQNTNGWERHVVDLDLYAGQPVTLQIGIVTDSSLSSSLFVDDVAFQSYRAGGLPLGDVVTYTIDIENAGAAVASNVILTDALPSGVSFETGVMTGSVIFPVPDTLTWGPWDIGAGESYPIRFTASVTESQAFAGQTITNTVVYASDNAGSGESQAAFNIEPLPQLTIAKDVSSPADGTPLGGVVTYTIDIENNGTAVASNVTLTDVLPTGVSFGTGIMTGSVIFPAPDTLTWGPWDVGVGESHTIRFTANVTESQAFAGQTITNTVVYTSDNAGGGTDKAAFIIAEQEEHFIYLPLVMRGFSGSTPITDPKLDFSPEVDGYSFSNYGNEDRTWQDDLGAGDLINLFGAENVCASGSTAEDCVLTDAAEQWAQEMLNGMEKGHCEGMAVTSLRFYENLPFYTGDTTPGDFQAGAEKVSDLTLEQPIENYIAYYFATQAIDEVWMPTSDIAQTSTPSDILDRVTTSFEEGEDLYTLGVYMPDGSEGHAITPYAVEDKGEGVYWLYVYDNNFPGEERHVVITTTTNTWRYNTAANPDDPPELYEGDANSHSLDLSKNSWRDQTPFACPFCADATQVEFSLTAGGELLVTDAEGRRVGYDPATGQMVNEIPGARIVRLRGASPRYKLPVPEGDAPYRVVVSGQSLAQEVDTNLVMVGPGYVSGFEHIQLEQGKDLRMSMSPDGRQLTFDKGQSVREPEVFTAFAK